MAEHTHGPDRERHVSAAAHHPMTERRVGERVDRRTLRSKLNPGDHARIRELYRSSRLSMKAVGAEFGISDAYVHRILHGKVRER
jgi:hypothetical protein